MVGETFTGISKCTKEGSKGELKVIIEKSEKEPKFEENIAERIKLRKQESGKQPDTTDKLDLENRESAAQRWKQKWQGSKVLTPNQMLSRLLISLAQVKAGNNSERLKNEIRQLLYSLYR